MAEFGERHFAAIHVVVLTMALLTTGFLYVAMGDAIPTAIALFITLGIGLRTLMAVGGAVIEFVHERRARGDPRKS